MQRYLHYKTLEKNGLQHFDAWASTFGKTVTAMELDTEVSKLKLIKSSFMSQIYDLEDKVVKFYPKQIAETTARIKGLETDIHIVKKYPKTEDKFNTMTIDGFEYFEKEKAGNTLIECYWRSCAEISGSYH